jgi:hypothetical protein
VRREHAVEALDADVEALDEQVELVRLGRGARLVDLIQVAPSPISASRFGLITVAGDVERQLAPGLDLLRAAVAGAERPSLGVWCSSYDQIASV